MTRDHVQALQNALKREAEAAGRRVAAALEALARVHADRLSGGAFLGERHRKALQALAHALSRLQAAADLGGRLEIRFPRTVAAVPEDFAGRPPVVAEVVPVVAFEEAVRDLAERDPYGAHALERAGLEVSDVYGAITGPDGEPYYPHGFALARAADVETAQKVKERLVAGMAQGKPTPEIVEELSRGWDWPVSYSATVVRTNFNAATSAGRFREAEEVAGAGIPVGFRYSCVLDSNLRQGRPQDNGENHRALDGLVARQDDPIWDRFSPPGGYSCRCLLEPVVGDEVPKGFVTIPSAARFAPGFGSRPSRSGPYRG